MTKFDPNNPEGMLKMSKKGQTLMMFATVSGTCLCFYFKVEITYRKKKQSNIYVMGC